MQTVKGADTFGRHSRRWSAVIPGVAGVAVVLGGCVYVTAAITVLAG
ncbi:hypothetical protein [Actinophytocola algeriensis]|uniref:Uncharacterized protein n=1 Tax=Actinophytocola algeriensis TaxID=1768010 RepID=A0A7W7Q1J8_9PSEU|nr:hypothetical protein [Actinophytocola algeriensis]MBB4905312.1 hypothetical protein [Actinophytocola algeriensis]MBE1473003.1 hypothetical protein [Actinophytocola algeriensis]